LNHLSFTSPPHLPPSPPAIKFLRKTWARLHKAEKKTLLKTPSIGTRLKVALKEDDRRGGMTRRSSQMTSPHDVDNPENLEGIDEDDDQEDRLESQSSDSAKDDDWIEDDSWGARGYFRPTDRMVLNESDPHLPVVATINEPLRLVNEALEVSALFFFLFFFSFIVLVVCS